MISPVWLAFGTGFVMGIIIGLITMGVFSMLTLEKLKDEMSTLYGEKEALTDIVMELENKPKPKPRKYRKRDVGLN